MVHALLFVKMVGGFVVGAAYLWVLLQFVRRHRWPAMWHLIGSTALMSVSLGVVHLLQLFHIYFETAAYYPVSTIVLGAITWSGYALVVVLCGETHVCRTVTAKTVSRWKRVRYGR